jgi:predicted transcriptional regulator/transcriptional regulator with XRE-family HTH domain
MAIPRNRNTTRLGPTIKRLRRNRGLTQARLAEQLGISASYLNLIEHNQRNVTADLLLQFADMFGLELGELMNTDENRLFSDVMEAMGDELFAELDVTNVEVRDLVSTQPVIAQAILALYDAYRKTRTDLASLGERLPGAEGDMEGIAQPGLPLDVVSDFIQANMNHFPSLEAAAQAVRDGLDPADDLFQALVAHLEGSYGGIRVALLPGTASHLQHGTVRRFDPINRSLVVSELLEPSSRVFQVAHQIGLLAAAGEIGELLDNGGLTQGDARALGRSALANYFAAALIMPYEAFIEAARFTRYDVEMLEHRFGVSFEQVCHRLTTLQRPGDKGVPFHMLRVDIAGNPSKRFSASGLRIPRHGGACPRWNVYSAFMTPGRILTQLGVWPDGSSFFCIARAIRKRGGRYGVPESYYSIGLGCEASYARELIYSDGVDLANPDKAIPVGNTCRLCDRMNCRQRAFPPIHHRLDIDENSRGLSAYVTAR